MFYKTPLDHCNALTFVRSAECRLQPSPPEGQGCGVTPACQMPSCDVAGCTRPLPLSRLAGRVCD